jgi:hypothetical protein
LRGVDDRRLSWPNDPGHHRRENVAVRGFDQMFARAKRHGAFTVVIHRMNDDRYFRTGGICAHFLHQFPPSKIRKIYVQNDEAGFNAAR